MKVFAKPGRTLFKGTGNQLPTVYTLKMYDDLVEYEVDENLFQPCELNPGYCTSIKPDSSVLAVKFLENGEVQYIKDEANE